MQPAVGDGVTSISEPITREPWRAGIGSSTVRRDYRCNAKMLEPSLSHRWAWRITVNQVLHKFGRETVSSLYKKLLQMHNRGVWRPVDLSCLLHRNQKIIRSLVFFKEKTFSAVEVEMPKAYLTGGYKQDESINSGNDT